MNAEETKQRFSKRIRENYEDFLEDWLSQESEELVSCAEEIFATKMLSEALPQVASIDEMAYLLHYENPLEVVRDGWMSYDAVDISKELKHVLWFTEHNASLWADYALSNEKLDTPGKAPITVGDFLRHYPDETFDMMTSGGVCTSDARADAETSHRRKCHGKPRLFRV